MKVVITGSNGQLGSALMDILKNEEILGIDVHNCDITVKEYVVGKIIKFAPNVVIHCAAYNAVDAAEDDEENCFKVNADATTYIAEVCHKINARLLYVSTDYIFAGDGTTLHETMDETKPLSVYGRSKLQGEKNIKRITAKYYIVRTSWLFGNGDNFVKTMLQLSKEKSKLSIVSDQVGSPTYAVDLAFAISEIISTEKYGIYHVTNEGFYSWADFAKLIFEKVGKDISIDEVESEAYNSKAKRPLNSRMSNSSLIKNGFSCLPSVENALERYLLTISQDEV